MSSEGSKQLGYILDDLKYEVVSEYRFDQHYGKRKFRSDYAILKYGILLEYEGINCYKSGHLTISGYFSDCNKYNLANILGFKILRYTMKHLDSPSEITQDIIKLVDVIQDSQMYNQRCCTCNQELYIIPNLWLKTETGFRCLMCQWKIDKKIR